MSGVDRERMFEAYHKLLIETLRLLGVAEVRVQSDSFNIIGFELQFSMITNVGITQDYSKYVYENEY